MSDSASKYYEMLEEEEYWKKKELENKRPKLYSFRSFILNLFKNNQK